MSVPGLLFALLLWLLALAIVARPLLGSARRARRTEGGPRWRRDQLRIHYDRALTNIRDLDEDFATGKISRDDHKAEREIWAGRGIRLLRALDEMEREGRTADAIDAERIERAIAEAVAAYRLESPRAQSASLEGEAE